MDRCQYFEPVKAAHVYDESHPVHCSCNRAETLQREVFITPTVIVTTNAVDALQAVIVGAFRIDCDAVLDSDRAVS